MVCFVIFTITKEFLTSFQSMKVSESIYLAVKFKNSIINKEVKDVKLYRTELECDP